MTATAEKPKKKTPRTYLRPLGDRVVILPDDPESVSKGGIVIPETAKERPQLGTVLEVGKGEITESGRLEMEIEVGDRVLFTRYCGSDIDLGDGVSVKVLRQGDVLAIVSRGVEG